MKYFLTLFSLLAVSTLTQAQFSYATLHLTSAKKIKHIQRVPFSKVEVFDNRFDTTNFLVKRTALKTPEMDSFSMPASEEIKNYIEKIIEPFPKDARTVYINLKQLRFGNLNNLSRFLFFTAEAYTSVNKGMVKIFSLEKRYLLRNGYRATITHALNDFVKKISKNYNLDTVNGKTYTSENLTKNVMVEWADLPIINQNNYVDGIYRTWSNFRDDKIDSFAQFDLQLKTDSTYRISFFQKNHMYERWDGLVSNIFVVSYNGNLYIPILGKYFVPLEKKNNTFYFYVPHSLPDMFIIMPNWNLFYINPGRGSSDFNNFGNGFGNMDARAFIVLIGVVIVVAITVAVLKSIERNNQRKKEAELMSQIYPGENFRNCFIDMGTGDIIYH
jgi:hypothetical protein